MQVRPMQRPDYHENFRIKTLFAPRPIFCLRADGDPRSVCIKEIAGIGLNAKS